MGHELRTALGFVDQRRMIAESRALLDRLGVAIDPTTPAGELTVAGQQMVEIAKALVGKSQPDCHGRAFGNPRRS